MYYLKRQKNSSILYNNKKENNINNINLNKL